MPSVGHLMRQAQARVLGRAPAVLRLARRLAPLAVAATLCVACSGSLPSLEAPGFPEVSATAAPGLAVTDTSSISVTTNAQQWVAKEAWEARTLPPRGRPVPKAGSRPPIVAALPAMPRPQTATRQPAAQGDEAGPSDREARAGRGYRKLGKPYVIAGITYTPRHEPDYDETGIASFYGADWHGKSTANGEIYDQMALTAAHKTLPLPSYVVVENLENGRKVKVRLNDRGPFVEGRIIDLSVHAAELLGFTSKGLARVRVTYLGPAPVGG